MCTAPKVFGAIRNFPSIVALPRSKNVNDLQQLFHSDIPFVCKSL